MKCANDIWTGRIPTCEAGFLVCDPMTCERYRPVREDKKPRVYTIWELFQLLEEHGIEFRCWYARPSQAYILSFRKGSYSKEVCFDPDGKRDKIPMLIENAILDAVKELEKEKQK